MNKYNIIIQVIIFINNVSKDSVDELVLLKVGSSLAIRIRR